PLGATASVRGNQGACATFMRPFVAHRRGSVNASPGRGQRTPVAETLSQRGRMRGQWVHAQGDGAPSLPTPLSGRRKKKKRQPLNEWGNIHAGRAVRGGCTARRIRCTRRASRRER